MAWLNCVDACAIIVTMNGDYEGLLRRVLGEPTVSGALWDTVTSVGEGDEGAYVDALMAVGRAYGYYCVEPAIGDERTPGVVLDAVLGGWPTVQHLWRRVAKHPNVTANVERWCRQKRSVKLNAALAASHGVSDETVECLLRSKAPQVIGALLGNAALSEDVLRRAEARAQEVGMYICYVVSSGKRNASMPVDIVESWLTCSNEQARLEALESPVAPRNMLWGRLTKDARFDIDSSVGLSIFDEQSNADGDMIDWFLSRWEERDRDVLQSNTQRRWWVAGAVLSHPRARATTLERLYVRYGAVNWWLCLMVAKAPSCPDWVRRDAIRCLARDGLAGRVEVDYPSASPGCTRLLYGFGCLDAAADCENAPGDLLAEVLKAKLRKAVEAKGDGSNSVPRFTPNDVIVPLSHDNMPPDVRRECARWLPEVLWAVARDGFLGRA